MLKISKLENYEAYKAQKMFIWSVAISNYK
jgi:hypothetical protein